MKKLYFIPFYILASILIFSSCSSHVSTSKVTIDLGGNQASLPADIGISKDMSGTTNPPPDNLSTVEIVVTNGPSGETLFTGTYPADKAETQGISAEIPSGENRYFSVTARTTGIDIYTGTANAVNLQAGVEATVSIPLVQGTAAKDATVNLTIFDPDGVALDRATLLGSNADLIADLMTVKAFIPTISEGTFSIEGNGTPVDSFQTTTTSIGSSATLSVYPRTFQVLLVKVFASDGGVSFVGGTIAGSLSSGTNAVSVHLIRPSVIKLNLPSAYLPTASSVYVSEIVNGTEVPLRTITVPAGSWVNPTPIDAYSGVSDYTGTYQTDRTIRVKVNGVAQLSDTIFGSTLPLKWKSTAISPN